MTTRGNVADQVRMRRDFRQMLTAPDPGEPPSSFGDLLVFSAVRRFPQRVKCAMLAWRALEQALSSSPTRDVTTEDSDAL